MTPPGALAAMSTEAHVLVIVLAAAVILFIVHLVRSRQLRAIEWSARSCCGAELAAAISLGSAVASSGRRSLPDATYQERPR